MKSENCRCRKNPVGFGDFLQDFESAKKVLPDFILICSFLGAENGKFAPKYLLKNEFKIQLLFYGNTISCKIPLDKTLNVVYNKFTRRSPPQNGEGWFF